jgi:hypothetical protein
MEKAQPYLMPIQHEERKSIILPKAETTSMQRTKAVLQGPAFGPVLVSLFFVTQLVYGCKDALLLSLLTFFQ